MRLIDAESLKHELVRETETKSILARRSLFWIIDDMPTIEVEPERRGRWIENEFGAFCECCGRYAYRGFGEPWKSDYCPCCGAKMENEDE